MSIQIAKSQKIYFKFLYKFKLYIVLDLILFLPQYIKRFIYYDKRLSVFYPYYSSYTHPYIKNRMYGKNAPISWSQIKKSNLIHALQVPPQNTHGKPFIVEPNDQILTLCGYFGATTPKECLQKVHKVKELLDSDLLKGVIIGKDGLYDQFRYYFGDQYLKKLIFFPMMRCIPAYEIEYFKTKINNLDLNCDFLFLASSFEIKAVEIVIQAWFLNPPMNSTLYVVCNDIPRLVLEQLKNLKSVVVINQIPVKEKIKKWLLENCSVTIAVTHIDGGGNAYEGIEYGHAIITNDFHRGEYLIGNENGILVDFKNKYYEPGKYGILWNSFQEYLNIVQEDIKMGCYQKSIQDISNAMNLLNSDRNVLNKMRINSLKYSYKESLYESNIVLNKIYNSI